MASQSGLKTNLLKKIMQSTVAQDENVTTSDVLKDCVNDFIEKNINDF